jgi:hypothetical protein
MKNILYKFVEGQTHFDMPRGGKIRFSLNGPKQVAPHSSLNTTSEHAPQVERN